MPTPQLSGSRNDLLIVPRSPVAGNWIGLLLFVAIGIWCGLDAHWKIADVLWLLGVASFLTPATCWVFDKSTNQLTRKRRNGLFAFGDKESHPLNEIVSVDLKMRMDNEGGRNYAVRLLLHHGQEIVVSDRKRDADRIAEFLGIEKKTRDV
jgi:hypothetical protein